MTLRASVMLALFALLAGCASTLSSSSPAHTSAAQAPPSRPCAATVLETLGGVLDRVYHEGVASERTAAAEHLIAGSVALREAVEDDNAPAARAAAAALIATGHMTNLRVIRAGHTLVDLGGPALVGLKGSLLGIDGAPIATYVTSVWADSSFIEEGDGIAEGSVVLRAGRSSIGGRAGSARSRCRPGLSPTKARSRAGMSSTGTRPSRPRRFRRARCGSTWCVRSALSRHCVDTARKTRSSTR